MRGESVRWGCADAAMAFLQVALKPALPFIRLVAVCKRTFEPRCAEICWGLFMVKPKMLFHFASVYE